MIVELRRKEGEGEKLGGRRKIKEKQYRGRWDKEGRERFRVWAERVEMGEGEVDEEVKEMGTRIREVLEELEGTQRGESGKRKSGWWDGECRERKREVRRELRKWRKGKNMGERV